jgi:replicative DNA helicase
MPAGSSIAPVTERDPVADRQPPYSLDAERAVLAAMMMETDAIMRASELLDDTMFYQEGHRRLYRAMVAIVERGAVVDPFTLGDELERRDELKSSGGKEYIAELIDYIPTAANIEYHARIVKEKAMLRHLIEVSESIAREAYNGHVGAADLLDEAEHRVLQLSQSRGTTGFFRIKELVWPAIERIEEQQKLGGALTGISSGFPDLDSLTAGFQRADLIIVAARPAMGKTSLVLNITQHVGIEQNMAVAFFSLEMSKDSLVQRFLTSEARIDAQLVRKSMLNNEHYARLARAAGVLSPAPIFIDDSAGISLLEMRSRARRLKVDNDIKLIVVDYLQLIRGPSAENRQQEISEISRSLKGLAKELDVPVIALSQLSRAPEQRGAEGKRPQLSDLRESGAIEQDADLVLFIYRPEVYGVLKDEAGNSLEGTAELIIGKQRNGPIGTVNLYFRKSFTTFESKTAREQ